MASGIFVVHKHFARSPHWDLRLEIDGFLKSWAMPKEPMMDPKVRRLAIQVDDHELGYADFEGEIPKGQYGAGVVKIWDKGDYVLKDKKDYKLIVELHGKKLKGEFVLVQMKDRQWLFFKKK
jgi:DNA ligase D-like protein (predicted 3'-phosphoesterase)